MLLLQAMVLGLMVIQLSISTVADYVVLLLIPQAPEVLTRQDGPHQEFCEFPRVNPTYKGKPHR